MSHPYGPTQAYPPQAGQPLYYPPEEPESFFHRFRVLFLVLGLVLGFGLASVAVAAVIANNAASAVVQTEPSAVPSITQAPPDGVAAPAPATTAPVPAPTRTIIIQPPAAQQAPVFSGLRYVGNGVYANSSTSNAFALAVHQAYLDGDYWHQPGVSQFWVYSTVTGQSYLMTSSSVGNPVVITGGNNALVQFNFGH
jgi:hypothetical protein